MKTQNSNDASVSRARNMVLTMVRMENNDAGGDRAIMATLRSGLRRSDGVALEMMPFVSKFLSAKESPRDARFFQIAALFALHPQNTFEPRNGSFAGAFRLLADKGSESIEKRFQMLLAGRDEDLFRHLQQAISLLKSENIPINWTRLLEDLTFNDWDDPDRKIQLKWAREFYRQPAAPVAQTEDAA